MKRSLSALGALLSLLIATHSTSARVLDSFDDNSKTGWTDFTFVPGVGLPVEHDGQFDFQIPGPVLVQANQGLFSASQKTSETFELKEGRKIEFRVDVVHGGAKDSFAVLGFLPTGNSPGTLAGYSLVKSTTDVLISKGVNKYFVADAGETANLKNENITLVLTLTALNGSVTIHGKVLDKDNNNAVIWEKKVVDTPAADVLVSGTDSPAAPYITSGYFSLFCYADYDAKAPEDPYTVVYDNAEVYVTDLAVVDNFDDNNKTEWSDFTFVPGVGLPVEDNGQFKFEIPSAVKQAIFSASQKISREFSLTEGERVEFAVDVVSGGAKDSFAVLGFIPKGTSPGTLSGYTVAKSTTDILISKGVNKYFVADSGEAANLKNENVTLDLALTAKNGSVIIDARVLDKDNNNAVLWQKSVVDTPAADVLASGSDSPAAPFITSGYFTLFLYADYDANAPEDPYQVTYDNAVAFAAAAAANQPPIISEVQPAEFASFVAATNKVSFQVSDDQPLSNDKVSLLLNGTNYTTANGLEVTGAGNTRTAALGGLKEDVNYTAVISVEDAGGLSAAKTVYFDTFNPANFVIEAEDYNFGGAFIDNPVVVAEGGGDASAYSLQTGVQDIDFNETRTSPRAQDTLYRPSDPVRMAHTLDTVRDKFKAAGGVDAGVFDYDVTDVAAGEWLNYTRTFPAGTYQVYLREALANMATGESVLEQVTSDPAQPEQTTRVLGSFLGTRTGFQYRNVPLTDGSGLNKVPVQLSGKTTLRLRQVNSDPDDGARYENYLIFIPVEGAGPQRASLSALSPAAGATLESVHPGISAVIVNRDTTVNTNSVKLYVNGQPAAALVTPNAEGASVSYELSPLPPSGSLINGRIEFADSENVTQTNEWTFTLSYNSLNAANRASGSPGERGFKLHLVQAPVENGALENSLARAEDQLSPSSTIPKFVDTNVVVQVVNFNEVEADAGQIPGDQVVPGLEPDVNGSDDFAVEIQAYLDLTAGIHKFGANTDDGFSIRSGTSLSDKTITPLAFRSGGTANQTFEFVVPQAGLYPFRMVWYDRGGGSSAEWFSVDPETGENILINDPSSPKAVKAYVSLQAPVLTVESATAVNGPYSADGAAVIDTAAQKISVPLSNTGAHFFRLNGASGLKISSPVISGSALTFSYGASN